MSRCGRMCEPWMKRWRRHLSIKNPAATGWHQLTWTRATVAAAIRTAATVEMKQASAASSPRIVPTSRRATRFRSKGLPREGPAVLFPAWAPSRLLVSRNWNATARVCVPRLDGRPIRSVFRVVILRIRVAPSERVVECIRAIRESASACDSRAGRGPNEAVCGGRRVDIGKRHGQRVLQQRLGSDEPAFNESRGVQMRMHRQHGQ